ncbi:hypothetical protein OV203_40290 [Nannocystis sp. ILAH1]|uniref:SBBP repeat-containing protein n=1 Tax=Nannocystis sp. ILAH1 TaxID=2996789 RepID=UPI00226FBEEC|nr:SBBP repeat-containing protein [Nannocystis sp. ILAH1]MCY0993447.1 hypothetical protein [Nannocystis sp. ILAH1]
MLAGSTQSADGIASAGAFQDTRDGYSDAFLARFDAGGTRLWGTYYGGSEPDSADAITSDAAGGLYVCGKSNSSDGIATPDAFLTTPPAWYPAESPVLFVAKFDDLGERQWGSYYGHITGYNESCGGITIDVADRLLHVAGGTNSTEGFATPGAHAEVPAGYGDAYILQWTQAFEP